MRCAAFLRAPWRDPIQAIEPFADEPWAAAFVSVLAAAVRTGQVAREERA